jgi:hypothetical protein
VYSYPRRRPLRRTWRVRPGSRRQAASTSLIVDPLGEIVRLPAPCLRVCAGGPLATEEIIPLLVFGNLQACGATDAAGRLLIGACPADELLDAVADGDRDAGVAMLRGSR